MANIHYVTKNIYSETAEKIENSSQKTTLIIGIVVAIPFLFIFPLFSLIIFFIALLFSINSGSDKTIVLRSGASGENYILSILKNLPDKYYIFNQVIIPNPRTKRGYNEADFIVYDESCLIIIEVKNHKGHIIGNEDENYWNILKIGRRGTPYEQTMYNPLKQVKNQAYTLKRFLELKGINCSIIPIVVFTNPECSYEITCRTESAYLIRNDRLIESIINLSSERPKNFSELLLNELINLKKGCSEKSSESISKKEPEEKVKYKNKKQVYEANNPYYYYDSESGKYIVTRWGSNITCVSKEAAEIISSDMSNDEVNRALANLRSR